ncbi:LysR family transcriptional regulator [Pandoraea thiooxydans]|uniref:LysR family transcriptional regulator n=1 Tax=Pandoraea thiooxydans TaxID=445709 RepID=A0A0G3ERV8_9BURK|nr:LysR substrate-binding domain-containing protein [Pandoraea thiooxydans]AKJ68769.1 LysR family transcriptional regulator [Pandoraea thiooxydans]APR96225.1 LysR family transcriptional regulator [Pandoraea thiooxydans]
MQRPREQIDAYLLRVLQILLTEQSVSRAALKLGQSQPAISNSLRRLREITGDAILVRGKSGMVATERGRELLAYATDALAAIDRITHPTTEFSPHSTSRVFQLGAPDYLDAVFLPKIAEVLRREAPQAKLIVHPINAGFDYVGALENGTLDVVIGNWLEPPPQLHMSRLFDDEVVCMLGNHHPLANKGISLKHYLELPHLAPTPYVSERHSFIDGCLAERGLRRHIQMTMPYFGLVPYVLMRTDLVFTTGRQFAQHYARYLPIRVVASPFAFPPMRFYQLWHERTHAAPEITWLRRRIAEVATELEANVRAPGRAD